MAHGILTRAMLPGREEGPGLYPSNREGRIGGVSNKAKRPKALEVDLQSSNYVRARTVSETP